VTSYAYQKWSAERAKRLDEIASSHAAVGGTSRGRRFTTLQINQSYAVMLTSQFQGFCRDLHDECIDHFVNSLSPPALQTTIRQLLEQGRKLDSGNPNRDNVINDFRRFGIDFWAEVESRDTRVQLWQGRLKMLTDWRNAIVHQDFDPQKLHRINTLTLNHVRQWRKTCNGLARVFDAVMRDYLRKVTGVGPW
jgi:hypothetical protein